HEGTSLFRRGNSPEAIESSLQNECSRMLVDDRSALGTAHVSGNQFAFDCWGGQPFVPQRDGERRASGQVAPKRARRLRTWAFAAVHVNRQAQYEPDHLAFGSECE